MTPRGGAGNQREEAHHSQRKLDENSQVPASSGLLQIAKGGDRERARTLQGNETSRLAGKVNIDFFADEKTKDYRQNKLRP